ncbi:uncharacterized protein LOC126847507 isoform X6 [Adelges cooleyi]|uniref:uncharacterized protein LOC126847507 isoform X6 n=1 Tax=Adelges cooleyi TaxID=133065 RepID=UPI00217F5918|nr:uncharacterized protein LOC126847507 isoform X6 [Adelges cooleyi]
MEWTVYIMRFNIQPNQVYIMRFNIQPNQVYIMRFNIQPNQVYIMRFIIQPNQLNMYPIVSHQTQVKASLAAARRCRNDSGVPSETGYHTLQSSGSHSKLYALCNLFLCQ